MSSKSYGDDSLSETRYNYYYIHTVFGHFVKDTLDYFTDYLYPRFQWKVVGTYNKAVEYLNKQIKYERETDQPMLPALILDPTGDFELDEKYGKMLYRFPNLAPGFAKYIYSPIYQDRNVLITVAFGRIIGDFNFTALLSSFYEYTDMRIYLNMIFGGKERYIYPKWFNSFIILPPEIYNYEYINEETGEKYKINLKEAHNQLVKTTNTDELVYPCRILPKYKLTGISDASTKFGGVSDLPNWKLNFTVSFEIEMPTYIILESNYLVEKIVTNIGYESCYSSNSTFNENITTERIPVNVDSFETNISHGLDSTSNTQIIFSEESIVNNKKSKVFKTRYYHIVTQEEADSTTIIAINIPEIINDKNLLILNGMHGNLLYDDHYIINNEGTMIIIDKNNVTLQPGNILEIYIYEYI